MYDLYPYFTNDGSVGLFSQTDDDIYHSTYGALTESWQKFILPSHLSEFMATHSEVKILDLCYGIGYNTKVALDVFVKYKMEKQKIEKNIFMKAKGEKPSLKASAAIYTDNNEQGIEQSKKREFDKKLNIENFSTEKIGLPNESSGAIYTNNILSQVGVNFKGMSRDFINKNEDIALSSTTDKNAQYCGGSGDSKSVNITSAFQNNAETSSIDIGTCGGLLIDAVDMDKLLMDISPFIINCSRNGPISNRGNNLDALDDNLKIKQVKNINNKKCKIKKEFKLRKETLIILMEKLITQNPGLMNGKKLQSIFGQKKYAPFLNRKMINYAKFRSNWGYKTKQKSKLSTFLHNIYYRYLSRSYKNANNLLKSEKISVNFHNQDARKFILETSTKYDFIFLDAFTPAKCPSLWSFQFIGELYQKLEDDGMVLTYSNSAAVRNAFLKNGFFVGKIYCANSKKAMGTVATKNINLIEHPLDQRDLDLINSKAGICYEDENLKLENSSIAKNRELKFKNSKLISSSKVLKGYKNGKIKSL